MRLYDSNYSICDHSMCAACKHNMFIYVCIQPRKSQVHYSFVHTLQVEVRIKAVTTVMTVMS